MHFKSHNYTISDYTSISICIALMAICSWITIPATVPFTLQTFAVFVTVGLLGGRKGTAAVAAYLLMGAIGLPVFAGFSGGIGYMLGATGGYIMGFLFSAVIMWGFECRWGSSIRVLTVSMLAGLLVCYAFGTIWFATVYSSGTDIMNVVSLCVLPFVVPDICKIILAAEICRRMRPILSVIIDGHFMTASPYIKKNCIKNGRQIELPADNGGYRDGR